MSFYNLPTLTAITALARACTDKPDIIRLRSTSSDYPILSVCLSALSASDRVGEMTQ